MGISTFSICGLRYHWKRDCPENPENKKEEEEPRGYLTFATIPQSVTKECMKIGIIDTGCTMTVPGEAWYQAFKSSVSSKINESRPDKTSIIFGDGEKVFSRRNVKIPAIIGDLNCFLSVEIVPVNIPLLISIKSLSLIFLRTLWN